MTNEATCVQGLLRARFWTKVVKTESCWLWTGAPNGSGYGQFCAGRKTLTAHRVAWAIANSGSVIPEGLVLDHLCRNKLCVNPAHLEVVTERVNIVERGTGPTAKHAAQTHCKYGHPFTPENTRINRRGSRDCRTCVRARLREAWARGARKRGRNG